MNNISHKKGCSSGINTAHVEPPPIPIIKETCNVKSDKYSIKLKLCRCPMYSTSDLYAFNMSLFDHGDLEEFLLFVCSFNMTLE